MKRIYFIVAMIFLFSSISSYCQIDKQKIYEDKYEKYTRLKLIGMVAIPTGVFLTAGGIAIYNSADFYYEQSMFSSTKQSDDPKATIGEACILVGVGFAIAGTVFTIVGINRSSAYKKRLERLNVGVISNPHNTGLVFSYRF
jgi:hypothetical protein